MKNFFKNNYVLIFIVIFAAVIRVLNLGYQLGSHPDERGIVMISEGVEKNHYNPKNFHYGHLVYYSLFFTSKGFKYLSEKFPTIEIFRFLSGYDGAFYIGRTFALLASLLTIIFTFLLCKRLFNNKNIALLAAFFLATNPFFIQLSRYYTTDIFVTCFLVMCASFAYKAYKIDSYKNYLLSIICASLGFVCKISAGVAALPLFFIFILFLIYNKNYKSVKFYFKFVFIPIVLSLCTMFVCEPFMFFDYQSFFKDNILQINMLKGQWMPPYTRQYLGTMPIFYHLKQMFFYTIRPLVAILAILGFYTLYFKTKGNKIAKIFLFLFAFPSLIITSNYFVKFPRYLLILYPFFMIFAAYGVTFFKERFRRLLGTIFVLISLIIAIDSITIYFGEHTYTTASKWIYNNVPKGSVIINPHWDDVLPTRLPGFDPHEYNYQYHEKGQSLNIYEESNEKFLNEFANVLNKGDYIVLPSEKALRGILDKFDQKRGYSIKILTGLFDGSLGYQNVYVYKLNSFLSRLGFYSDDLADESLSLYDHPKAYVFKNVKKLSVDDLKTEIKKENKNRLLKELLTIKNFEFNNNEINKKITKNHQGTFITSILYVILWLIALDLMSLYIIPFFAVTFKNFQDKGIGIFRVLGLIMFSFIVWFAASVFDIKVNQFNLLLILLSLYFISYIFIKIKKLTLKDFEGFFTKDTLKIEIFFLIVFFIFLIFKFLSPEIVWGEKTMDLGFLNYFVRQESYPCNDPWSIDNKLAYYFFGYFIFGLIHKLFSIPTQYGFNLSLVTIAAMLATSLTTLIFYFKKHINFSIFAAFSIVILSNFEKFYIYFLDRFNLFSDHPDNYSKVWHFGFDLFWKTSRVHEFSSNAISEYPFWSLIFSDLHPHVMAMPIFVCMIFLFAYLIKEEKYSRFIYLFFPVTAVTLCMTNTWDAITICVFGVILVLIALTNNFKKALYLVETFVFLGAISLLLFIPFYFYNLQASENHIGWVQTIEFHRIDHVFRHFGFWLIPILLGFLINLKNIFKEKSFINLFLCFLISLAPCIFASFSTFNNLSWGIQIFSSILIFIGLSKLNDENLIQSVFIVVFAVLLSFTELCFIIDRPNTIFKFYIGMWFFISIASVLSLAEFFEFKPFRLLYAILFLICFLSSVISYVMMSKHTHIGDEKVKYTLNGIEFLKNRYIDRYNVVSYINSHISGTPVLMENFGPSYHTNTSIPYQKYTGLPILHGWDHHISQRGTSRDNMDMKKREISKFYKTYDKEIIKRIINKYNIDLVVVGEKELESYELLKRKPNKFEEFKDIFTLLYSSNNESVYVVNSRIKNMYLFK
ncbi:MAG: DUF2298 domain-containing protein [Pseudomonadota bacterium]|nr:DUF2298 domain-containing protein [Pseudomonadota bacterium]